MALLVQTRQKVEGSGLDQGTRDQILRRLDRKLTEMKQFVEQNRPRIELDKRNNQVRQSVDHDQQVKLENQQKLAAMVEEYNQLMREQRVDEAEVVAKRAVELDPRNGVAQQILQESKLIRAYTHSMAIKGDKEEGFLKALENVDIAGVPFNDNEPFVMGDAKHWDELTRRRRKFSGDAQRPRWSERELEIKRKLKTPVMVSFNDAPLSQVMDYLAKQAQVNLFLDPEGLAQEGVSTAAPVTLNLAQEISLQSALNLILQPRHLAFVIKDEVLKITSEQLKNGEVYTVTYNVADLVIPIPNFVPSQNMGLSGAYHDAMSTVGFGQGGGLGGGGAAPSGRGGQQRRRQPQRHDQPGADGPGLQRQPRRQGRRRPARQHGRTGRTGRRLAGRLRQPHRPDHLHHPAHHLGRRGRSGLDRPLRNQPQHRRQPNPGRPRADRQPAGTVAAPAGPAGDHRGPLHHPQRQLLRIHRRGLRLQAQSADQPEILGFRHTGRAGQSHQRHRADV